MIPSLPRSGVHFTLRTLYGYFVWFSYICCPGLYGHPVCHCLLWRPANKAAASKITRSHIQLLAGGLLQQLDLFWVGRPGCRPTVVIPPHIYRPDSAASVCTLGDQKNGHHQ